MHAHVIPLRQYNQKTEAIKLDKPLPLLYPPSVTRPGRIESGLESKDEYQNNDPACFDVVYGPWLVQSSATYWQGLYPLGAPLWPLLRTLLLF